MVHFDPINVQQNLFFYLTNTTVPFTHIYIYISQIYDLVTVYVHIYIYTKLVGFWYFLDLEC